jgi:Family of unknown function (DUF6152)
MKRAFKFISLLSLGFLSSGLLFAHHGSSAFDTGKKLTLAGTVTEWFWANPHCFLKFDAKNENGEVVHWVAETSNPPDMANLGWTKQSFKPGDEVTVTVEPVKNGRPAGRVLQVTFSDGRTLHATGRPPDSTGNSAGQPQTGANK